MTPNPTSEPEIRRLQGSKLARTLRGEVAQGVEELLAAGGRRPRLVAVLVGDDPASRTYVASKARACEEVGIVGETRRLPGDLSAEELLAEVHRLSDDDEVDGILVQLPLPDHIPSEPILDAVAPEKDVDGFHPHNVGLLWLDRPAPTPATPTGIVELLKREGVELEGRHAVIVGRSAIVGKPMAGLLLRENMTVTVCHSRTRDLPAVCRRADVLIVAVGRTAFAGPEHVREGAVVVDVGINRISDRAEVERLFPGNARRLATLEKRGSVVVGDVDYHRVAPHAGAITPVPGGVGPLTVAMLLVNTLEASKRRQGIPS